MIMKESQLVNSLYSTCQQQQGRIEFAPEPSMVFCSCHYALPQVEKKLQGSQMSGKEESFALGTDRDSHQTLREALEEEILARGLHRIYS
ncbi:MAG: hypothetical protein PHT07_20630 [Paludibacter sp.]|nr:hypothetical protein [Paludibacter sp.]